MCTCKYNIATPGRCSKCGAELVEQSVLVGERSYCVGCFVCGQCGATLAGKYYELEGVVSCQQCRWGTLVKVLMEHDQETIVAMTFQVYFE